MPGSGCCFPADLNSEARGRALWYTDTMTTRGRPFSKGKSPNPSGRPKGSRSRATLTLDAILEGEAEAITRKAIELAKDGDTIALRLCLDRLYPARKDRPVTFTLPEIAVAADLTKATHALLAAVAAGELTPSEASELGKVVDAHMKAIEVAEIAARLTKLEEVSQ